MNTASSIRKCQLISVKELAEILCLSKRQIHRLNSSGRILAPLKIGGSLRWDLQECTDWIAAGAVNRKTWEAMKDRR